MVTHDATAAGCARTTLQLEKGEFRATVERAT